MQAHGREGLDRRARFDAWLLEIATKLSAHEIIGIQRQDRTEDLDLLVLDRLGIRGQRRFHRQVCHDLEQMILHHVADRAVGVIKSAAALYAKTLGHRDLHALNVAPIPYRLEKGIGKTEQYQILYRLLA